MWLLILILCIGLAIGLSSISKLKQTLQHHKERLDFQAAEIKWLKSLRGASVSKAHAEEVFEKPVPSSTQMPKAIVVADTPEAIAVKATSGEAIPPPRQILPQPVPKSSAPGTPIKPSGLSTILEKIGLMPPKAGSESLMAWWSTRIGIVLGVIAAVFLGMYVNQNTGPLLRWLQVTAISVSVFLGGYWMEKRLPAFGRALVAGGLGLIYVSAFATYGLPAMKITDSAVVGAVAQMVAIGFMCGWALFRRSENIFTFAIILGYVTCTFTLSEGISPLPYISLLSLAVLGSAMYAWKGWQSGLVITMIGSALGFITYTIIDVSDSSGWGMVATCAVLMLWYLACLGWRLRVTQSECWLSPTWLAGVFILTALITTKISGLDLSWTYLFFAFLTAGVGVVWHHLFDSASHRNTFWAKSTILLALFFVTYLDGPVRAFALLAQAGSLIFLAKKESSRLFEILAMLALVVSCCTAKLDMSCSESSVYWVHNDWFLLAFCLLALGLLTWHTILHRDSECRNSVQDTIRYGVHIIATILISSEIVYTGASRPEWPWAFILPLTIGAVAFAVHLILRTKVTILVPIISLIGTAIVLIHENSQRSILDVTNTTSAVQGILWISFSWCAVPFLYKTKDSIYAKSNNEIRNFISAVAILLLVASVVFYRSVGHGLISNMEWVAPWMLALAVLWQVLEGRIKIPYLEILSILPASLALCYWGYKGNSLFINAIVLLLSLVYALIGWHRWKKKKEQPFSSSQKAFYHLSMWSRMVFVSIATAQLSFVVGDHLGGAYLALLALIIGAGAIIAATYLRETVWNWMGILYLFTAGLINIVDSSNVIILILTYLCYLGAGVYLSRHSDSKSIFTRPKVASILFGLFAFLLVILTVSSTRSWQNFMTASWALSGVGLVISGFIANLRGYRVIGLIGLACAILRLFSVDIQDGLWRIIGFGLTGALFVGLGYVYSRYHKRLANGDVDFGVKKSLSN